MRKQPVGVRLEPKLVHALDEQARAKKVTRSELIQELLAQGVGYETHATALAKLRVR